MHLRRGWREGSPTFRLHHVLTKHGAGSCLYLGSVAPLRTLEFEQLVWLVENMTLSSGMLDLMPVIAAGREELVQTARHTFGVGPRDAPSLVLPFLTSIIEPLLEPRVRCLPGPQGTGNEPLS